MGLMQSTRATLHQGLQKLTQTLQLSTQLSTHNHHVDGLHTAEPSAQKKKPDAFWFGSCQQKVKVHCSCRCGSRAGALKCCYPQANMSSTAYLQHIQNCQTWQLMHWCTNCTKHTQSAQRHDMRHMCVCEVKRETPQLMPAACAPSTIYGQPTEQRTYLNNKR